ncbi:MAG TPA: hypothetical protein VL551_25590 [Actinospica sp.]|jgi:hypothetical protein|nr:hypothetical protein [Actinospica sp.]
MPLFNRRERGQSPARASSRLPADMARQLEVHARSLWDLRGGVRSTLRIDQMYFLAQEDRDGFLRELRAVVERAGGWAALGGKYLVTDILPIETDTEDFNAIVLAGYQFLRKNGAPPIRLSPNDHTLWQRVNTRGEPWLVWRDPPPDTLTPLRPDEIRKVAEIKRADGYTNTILVRQDGPSKFTAVIEGAYSEEDPRLSRNDWHTASSLHDLYIRIAESSQTPTDWAAPDLQPYFPLPPMTI